MRKCGILIAIEGIDGCGKTTQAEMLFDFLRGKGYDVLLLKEPTDGKYGQAIRKKLARLRRSSYKVSQEVYNLFLLDRQENVNNRIMPALKDGKIVILDRYFISTIAYQGAAGIPIEKIVEDNSKFPIPDLIIILDLPPELAAERLKRVRDFLDNFELNFEFLEKVRQIYLTVPKLIRDSEILIIDATKGKEEIHKQITNKVLEIISKKKGCIQ